ncbi:MAG: biotin/lipoyl-binding protein [Phycisphaerales bacterium]|nr:biotin/lipoyl-binding protein [Phycisphaerales bacterium]
MTDDGHKKQARKPREDPTSPKVADEPVAPIDMPELKRPVARIWIGRGLSVLFLLLGPLMGLALANELNVQARTQDAYVRANVIGIAAHVSGAIVELNVVDNQPVHEGDILFVVDPRPYEVALAQAEADLALVDLQIAALQAAVAAEQDKVVAAEKRVEQAEADAFYAIQYYERIEPLLESRFVTPDQVVKARTEAEALQAAVRTYQAQVQAARSSLNTAVANLGQVGDVNARRQAAEVAVANAELFLDYCYVKCPIDGYITNLNISQGEYANEGEQVFAIVDRTVWYVMANFKETYLPYIKPGDMVEVYLMSRPNERWKGTIQGIGWALYQANGATIPAFQLPDVSPTLDWVRLAQRFPVRIIIEEGPDSPLRMGETAAVIALPGEDTLPPPMFPRVRAFFDWLGLDT